MSIDIIAPTLALVHAAFAAYMLIPDLAVLQLVLAARIAHDFEGAEAIGFILVGPSSSGKTEFVVALGRAVKGYLLSDLTPQTLLSGWQRKRGNSSLLHQLRDNILVIKDLTSILSGNRDKRAAIMAQFREVLDGAMSKTWGNGERVAWVGKVSIFAASTPVIDEHYAAINQLGTRFLFVRTEAADAMGLSLAALSHGSASKTARAVAEKVVIDYIAQFEPCALSSIELSPEHADELSRLARFIAFVRTPVERDRYTRNITSIPVPEGTPRVAKQLHAIAAALARMAGRTVITDEDMALVGRLAWDSAPRTRGQVLRALRSVGGRATAPELNRALGQPTSFEQTVRRTAEDLVILGVLQSSGGERPHYFLTDIGTIPSPPAACAPDLSANPICEEMENEVSSFTSNTDDRVLRIDPPAPADPADFNIPYDTTDVEPLPWGRS